MSGLELTPCTVGDARSFVEQHHRHHPAPVGGLFAVAVAREDIVVGVAIVGRPVARGLDDEWTAEVTRVAVIDGVPNACSKLYGACWRASRALGYRASRALGYRASRALGYRRLVTYTLAAEPGISLRAAGWKIIAEVRGRSWSCKSRPRVDRHPTQDKLRWEATS